LGEKPLLNPETEPPAPFTLTCNEIRRDGMEIEVELIYKAPSNSPKKAETIKWSSWISSEKELTDLRLGPLCPLPTLLKVGFFRKTGN